MDKYDKHGCSPGIADVSVPDIKQNEVLVRVHAAGVNPLDNMIIRGEVRLVVPYKMPGKFKLSSPSVIYTIS